MRDTPQKGGTPLSLDVAPLSALQKVDLPRVEVSFFPFVAQRLVELSADLCGEDAYWVGHNVISFAALSVNAPLKAHDLREQDSFALPLATV